MKVFLAAVIFVGLCVLGLGVNIFFRGREFPKTDVGSNPEMRKRGIKCPKEEEMERLTGAKRPSSCTGKFSDACLSCALYKFEK